MASCVPVGDSLSGLGEFEEFGYNMGMGKLGDPRIDLKRKFRWLMSISFCDNSVNHTVPPHFCKVAARPDLAIEELELNFLNSKTWIAGKASWEAISVTYLDVSTADNIALWSWIGTIYNFFGTGNGQPCYWQATRDKYQGIMTLVMLDGCGNVTETWEMQNAFPTSIKFGELDYSANETVDIELQIRYSQVAYSSECGGVILPCECTPCGSGGGSGDFGGGGDF